MVAVSRSAVPVWHDVRSVLSQNFTEPTIIPEPTADQIQYEFWVRRNLRWPSLTNALADAQKAAQAVVGRALSCVVMPLYADWVQYRTHLSEFLSNLSVYLPVFDHDVNHELQSLRGRLSQVMDRIDFLEQRLTLLEQGQVDREALSREAPADDQGQAIAVRIDAAQRRAERVRGRSRSPAPSELSQHSSRGDF